jgi:ABC-type multidrug transport system ATPase subunit
VGDGGSYVDQDPSALGTQTVRELLLTAARLRLPELVTEAQKKERIAALATEFGIDHILDRRFGEAGT